MSNEIFSKEQHQSENEAPMSVDKKLKRLGWLLLSQILGLVSGVSVCLIGIMVAENTMTSHHWTMAWGFVVLSLAGKAYRLILDIAA